MEELPVMKKKRHWLIRSIGWVGVAVMTLTCFAIFAESYRNREVAPWELRTSAVLAFAAGLCLAQQALFLAMIAVAIARLKVSRWRKSVRAQEISLQRALELLRLKDLLAKDGKAYANAVKTVVCLCAMVIAMLFATAKYKYESDPEVAQMLWCCFGVPLIYITGIMSVVLGFFVFVHPIVRWLVGRGLRWVGFTEEKFRNEFSQEGCRS